MGALRGINAAPFRKPEGLRPPETLRVVEKDEFEENAGEAVRDGEWMPDEAGEKFGSEAVLGDGKECREGSAGDEPKVFWVGSDGDDWWKRGTGGRACDADADRM